MSTWQYSLETIEGVAQMFQSLCDYANVTDEEVASLINVNSKTVQRWRNGESQPKVTQLVTIFRKLNVPMLPFIMDNSVDTGIDEAATIENYVHMVATKSELRDMKFNLTAKHGSSVSAQLALISMLNHMKLMYRLMVAKNVLMMWDIASKSGGLQYTDDTMPDTLKVYEAVVKSQQAFEAGRDSYTDI